jgi:hypothetical protein
MNYPKAVQALDKSAGLALASVLGAQDAQPAKTVVSMSSRLLFAAA